MINIQIFRSLALALPDASEQAHFEKTSFRIAKKIFATYDEKNNRACIKLSEIDQNIFCLIDKAWFYPVPNSWGKQGWTFAALDLVDEETFAYALKTAHACVSTKKPAAKKNKK
jgi:predicted DNA-binding protein (MmcQ/YjbR family)